ncbi:MAG TPA: hypothetical protein PKC43_07970 [Phycisphaerales bacterium]|nr:hypothetical protein [Phycisphaerales bacterium]HMP37374.1 hypothetical protein [Phycisphaerales bacterium]
MPSLPEPVPEPVPEPRPEARTEASAEARPDSAARGRDSARAAHELINVVLAARLRVSVLRCCEPGAVAAHLDALDALLVRLASKLAEGCADVGRSDRAAEAPIDDSGDRPM